MIAGHHAGGVAHDLADLARRHFTARFVDQADIAVGGRSPDRVQFVRMQMRIENAGAAALGHAVILGERAGPARQHIGLELGAKRRAGAKLEAERRKVVRIKIRQRHDALVLHRHQNGVGSALFLGELKITLGVELLHQHHAATIGQRRKEDHQRGVGIQRRRQQRDRLRPVLIGRAAQHMRPAHAVRLHDALGHAGGTRRIDDVERIARRHLDGLWPTAFCGQPCVERDARRHAVKGHAWQAGVQRRDIRRVVRKQPPGTRVAQHRCQGVAGGRWCQRRHRRPRPQRPKKNGCIRHGVQRADGHHIAMAHAVALQGGGDAIHQGIKLCVIQGLRFVLKCRMGGLRARMLPQQIGDGVESQLGEEMGSVHGADTGRQTNIAKSKAQTPQEAAIPASRRPMISLASRMMRSISCCTVGTSWISPTTMPQDHTPLCMSPCCMMRG
ncbi:hypothetical protein SDC9_83562 [bioreactor metagenome]|uniref:Uncharacterized protein n=1 Tax=bioreactor metagenome TaxID=1076179 RepID=A0A644Z9K3_9ZZZZ